MALTFWEDASKLNGLRGNEKVLFVVVTINFLRLDMSDLKNIYFNELSFVIIIIRL